MPAVPASFQFVDHSAINKKARRSIRSHVMKGRNVGKVRTPRRPLAATKAVVALASKPRDVNCNQEVDTAHEIDFYQARSSPKLLLQLGNELSGVKMPCSVSQHSRRFIHDCLFMCYAADSIYPPQLCLEPYDIVKDIWIRYMFIDEAYYHCLVALSEACISFIVQREQDSAEFTHHLTRGLQLVNAKLSGSHALSDVAICTVILLCLVSSIRKIPSQTKVHFDGLCRMINLRGGLGHLKENPFLTEKAQRYVKTSLITISQPLTLSQSLDIELSLQLGCQTQLSATTKRLDNLLPNYYNPAFDSPSLLANAVAHGDLRVFMIAQEITKVTRILNATVPSSRLYPIAFQDLVTHLTYRVLNIESVDGCQLVGAVTIAVHRGLLAFMLTFVTQLSRQRRIPYPVLRSSLTEALDDPGFLASVDPATHVWLLIVAGIYVLDKTISVTWLRPRLAEVMSVFGRTDWEFGRSLLDNYPWVDSLHNESASLIWRDCFGTTSLFDNTCY
ncbi:unnamed protein product [Clonostachys rosea]|uniref:Transcription factor domain-containing protein n=1 Tax=Bionectria ochroleuca TaxID=29856 RepID=A0ABY6TTC9_BIOOC|nr:unnamed protein product [Clonostachys rosea]